MYNVNQSIVRAYILYIITCIVVLCRRRVRVYWLCSQVVLPLTLTSAGLWQRLAARSFHVAVSLLCVYDCRR